MFISGGFWRFRGLSSSENASVFSIQICAWQVLPAKSQGVHSVLLIQTVNGSFGKTAFNGKVETQNGATRGNLPSYNPLRQPLSLQSMRKVKGNIPMVFLRTPLGFLWLRYANSSFVLPLTVWQPIRHPHITPHVLFCKLCNTNNHVVPCSKRK